MAKQGSKDTETGKRKSEQPTLNKKIMDSKVKISSLEMTIADIFAGANINIESLKNNLMAWTLLIVLLLSIFFSHSDYFLLSLGEIPLFDWQIFSVLIVCIGGFFGLIIYPRLVKIFIEKEMEKNTKYKNVKNELRSMREQKQNLEQQKTEIAEKKREEMKEKIREKERQEEERKRAIEVDQFIKKLRSCGLNEDQIHDLGHEYDYSFPFFSVSEEELMQFQGIGKKKANLLKRVGF